MPLYSYECTKCRERFDVTRSIAEHDAHREKCPKCGHKSVRQLMSTFFAQTSRKS
jgi:putative FmdB family regulatory protein